MLLKELKCLIVYMILLTSISTCFVVFYLPGDWPIWAEESSTCIIDSQCLKFETCFNKICTTFFPSTPTSKTPCHNNCWNNVQMYEQYVHQTNVGHLVYFEGPSEEFCVVTYQQTDKITAEIQYVQHSLLRREEVNSLWLVALCMDNNINP